MTLGNNGMAADARRAFDHPVCRFLLFEPAFVADKFFHFAPLILAGRNPENLIAAVPEGYFPRTFRTVPVCVLGFQKPDPVFEPESFIRQCAHGTNIDHVPDKVVFQRLMNIGRNFRMISSVQNTVFAFLGELIGHIHATVTEDAAGHVQLNIGTYVVLFKYTSFKLVPGSLFAVIVTQILQGTFSGLIADGTIQRMIDEHELHNTLPRIQCFFAGYIFYDHAIHHIGPATRHQFWHRPRIRGGSGSHFHQTGPAFAATSLQGTVIAHGRRGHLAAYFAGGIEYGGTRFYFDRNVIDRYFE